MPCVVSADGEMLIAGQYWRCLHERWHLGTWARIQKWKKMKCFWVQWQSSGYIELSLHIHVQCPILTYQLYYYLSSEQELAKLRHLNLSTVVETSALRPCQHIQIWIWIIHVAHNSVEEFCEKETPISIANFAFSFSFFLIKCSSVIMFAPSF